MVAKTKFSTFKQWRNVFKRNVGSKPEFTVKLCFVFSTQSVDITAIYSVLDTTKSCTECPNKHGK